jgi:hypothetical protein
MANKTSIFWDVLMWFGIILVLVWALLKSFGIIHSPIWMEMLPYFGVGVSAIGGAYKLGKIMEGINATRARVDRMILIEKRFDSLEHEHNLCKEGKLKFHK